MRHDLNKNNQELIDYAINNGINYFETCYFYLDHQCEDYVYSLLTPYTRNSYEICGKLSLSEAFAYNLTDYKQMYFEQLKKVPGNYFDVYILQTLTPKAYYWIYYSDLIDFFKKEKEKGNILRFGFSEQCDNITLKNFLNLNCWDIAQMPLNYYDWYLCDSDKNYNSITNQDIPIIAQAPLKGGDLINNFIKEPEKFLDRSLFQMAIDFVNSKKPEIILTGTTNLQNLKNMQQALKNYTSFNENMIFKVIEQYKKEHFISCIQCGKCSNICPQQIPIPVLFSFFNKTLYDKEKYFDVLSLYRYFNNEPINECINCGLCNSVCPINMNIPNHFLDLFNLNP